MSAEKAVRFFLKNKYTVCGEVLKSTCSGSPLFNRLVPMEKVVNSHKNGQKSGKKINQPLQSGSSSVKNTTEEQIKMTKEEKTEPVLQWNIHKHEYECTENWDDE